MKLFPGGFVFFHEKGHVIGAFTNQGKTFRDGYDPISKDMCFKNRNVEVWIMA